MDDSGLCRIFISGAKTTGPSHIKKGLPCQDAWACEMPREDSAVIAVADGLGSAKNSDKGADIAVRAAVSSVKEHYLKDYGEGCTSADLTKNETLIKEAFSFAVSEIEKYSISEDIPKNELACTLIVVFIYKNTVSAGQVGDGAVTAQFSDGDISVISEPAESEYINEVAPVTSDGWEAKLNINADITGIKHLAMFTDGCQRAVLVKEDGIYKPFIPFFRPLFRYLDLPESQSSASDEIKNLIKSDKMTEVSEDDKTLVVASIKNRGD